MVRFSPVAYGVLLTFRALALHRSRVCSGYGLRMETSATREIPQAKNIPYQPLLIKPVSSLLDNAEKNRVFSKTSLSVFICHYPLFVNPSAAKSFLLN